MLYEFAMTPELFDASVATADKAAGIILQQLLRGIAENGLLANLHGGRWLDHITKERIVSLSPPLRDKVLALLKILGDRHRLVSHPKYMGIDPPSDPAWLDLAIYSHRRIPFHAIIISQTIMGSCGLQCDAFVEFASSLDSLQWTISRQRTFTLTKSTTDYHKVLAPVLRHAKTLSLIDPYLSPYQLRYFDTVKMCSSVMGQRGHARLKGRIYIHADYGKLEPYRRCTVANYLDTWQQKLGRLVAADGHRFKVFLWSSLPGHESMHDRFILTDQCGISVPGGLDCRTYTHANSTDWSLLDEDARIRRLIDYDPAMSPFNLLAVREVV